MGRLQLGPTESRLLAKGFSQAVVERLGPKVYAIWLSGSLPRGDFSHGASDVDLELILAEGQKVRTTDDMEELKEVTRRFRQRAMKLGASEFHCFVFRTEDLGRIASSFRAFYALDTALHGETLYGKAPSEAFDVEKMEKEISELARRAIEDSARSAENILRGSSTLGIEHYSKLVMETDHLPSPMWDALSAARAANFATGEGEWRKPQWLGLFRGRFPEHKIFIDELWQYRMDQERLRRRGQEYVHEFIRRCLRFILDMRHICSLQQRLPNACEQVN